MATTADLISETKRHLLSLQREPMNKLAASMSANAGSLTLQMDVSKVQEGSHLQVGLELMFAWSVDQANKVVTVERAQLGSLATAHTAGAIVTVNPKFPDFVILKALNDELADLSAPLNGLFVMRQVELAVRSGASGYDLAGVTNLLEIHQVRHRVGAASSSRSWPVLTNYELSRSVSSVDFPSGLALFLAETGGAGQPLLVQYKAGFSPLASLTDDVEIVSGLPLRMHDIPPMGAAVRLVAPREIKRNFTESQGEPRRAQEVPPGAVSGSMRPLAGMRQNRITAEAGLLAQQYPDRSFIPQSNSAYGGWRGGYARGGRRW